jgi:lj965 prophage major tail protein
LGGGGVNSVIEFTLKIALQSELTFVDGIGG